MIILFSDFVPAEDERDRICKAVVDIEIHTCIRFKQIFRIPDDGQAFVFITNWQHGCFSSIGYKGNNNGPHVINLHPTCYRKRGIIEHELLHTVGLYHEHTRLDRDTNVKINWDQISDGNKNHFPIDFLFFIRISLRLNQICVL